MNAALRTHGVSNVDLTRLQQPAGWEHSQQQPAGWENRLQQIAGWENLTRIVFVRDPIERLISTFHDKFHPDRVNNFYWKTYGAEISKL